MIPKNRRDEIINPLNKFRIGPPKIGMAKLTYKIQKWDKRPFNSLMKESFSFPFLDPPLNLPDN